MGHSLNDDDGELKELDEEKNATHLLVKAVKKQVVYIHQHFMKEILTLLPK